MCECKKNDKYQVCSEIYKINDNHLDFFCKMLEKCVLSFVILFNKRIIYVWNVLLVRVLFSEKNTALS